MNFSYSTTNPIVVDIIYGISFILLFRIVNSAISIFLYQVLNKKNKFDKGTLIVGICAFIFGAFFTVVGILVYTFAYKGVPNKYSKMTTNENEKKDIDNSIEQIENKYKQEEHNDNETIQRKAEDGWMSNN